MRETRLCCVHMEYKYYLKRRVKHVGKRKTSIWVLVPESRISNVSSRYLSDEYGMFKIYKCYNFCEFVITRRTKLNSICVRFASVQNDAAPFSPFNSTPTQ